MQAKATIEVVTEGPDAPTPEQVARLIEAQMRCYIGPQWTITSARATNNKS